MFCSRSHSFPQWSRARPLPVRNQMEALSVIWAAVAQPLVAETMGFLLDDTGQGTSILTVTDTFDPDAVVDVADCLAAAGSNVVECSALVLASVRPFGSTGADNDADIDRWLDASETAGGHGILLLEWFVVGPGGAHCPRDLLGEPQRWAS